MQMKEKQAKEDENILESENLSDDDAIIRLYKSLKSNPPSMLQRMKNVDVDGDSKLT